MGTFCPLIYRMASEMHRKFYLTIAKNLQDKMAGNDVICGELHACLCISCIPYPDTATHGLKGGCFIWCCIFRSGTVSAACGRATLALFLSDSLSFVSCRLLLCSHSRRLCSPLSPCLGWSRLIEMPANTKLQPPLILPAFSLLKDPHTLVQKKSTPNRLH